MTVKSSSDNNLLLYYQCLLSVLFVLFFYTEADNHLFGLGITPRPYEMVIAYGLLAIPLLPGFMSKNIKYVPKSTFQWLGLYSLLTIIYYLFSSHYNEVVQQELSDRILAVIFLLIALLIFAGKSLVQLCVKWALFCTIFWNIYTYIYEVLNPGVWQTFMTLNPSGRPAGFYVDANKAACALIPSMIFSIDLVPQKYRLPFILIVIFGVIITFSRGATLCILVLILLLIYNKMLSKKAIIYFVTFGLIMAINSYNFASFVENQASNSGLLNKDLETRLSIFSNPSSDASDDTSRVDIIGFAWQEIMAKPLFGNGIGYVHEWGEILPHNMYLYFMVEHGILGIMILPLLIISVTKNAYGESKKISFMFGVFILIWSIFSHTVLLDRQNLMLFALTCIISKSSYFNHNDQRKNI